MQDLFLTNYSKIKFLDRIKDSFSKCNAFYLSVSFIKKAGLLLFEKEMEESLKRGVKGKIITSTYQNFTDIESLNTFLRWMEKYPNFEVHLDFSSFGDNGFHSKGYLFEYENSYEVIIGSSNITRFALLKNIEWNISLISKDKNNSHIDALNDFEYLWNKTYLLNEELIKDYKIILEYSVERWDMDYVSPLKMDIKPNKMQQKALKELRRNRDLGVKKCLIVSATGSGKTYLAAFDARNFDSRRLLYIVHRENILIDAKNTFQKIFKNSKTLGFFTGNKQDLDADFIFATSSMLARHLDYFSKDEFDYICYDEVHHIVADTGSKIFEYFEPEFILGLTATPERMDNKDVLSYFDSNVPYELRLGDAIRNDLVVPFHYYGIRDELLDYGNKNNEKISDSIVESKNIEFIKQEIEKHRKKGEKLKCIAFCVTKDHARRMKDAFNEIGYNAESLTSEDSIETRKFVIDKLQNEFDPLEIITTVDILNEGIDIPSINMVLFLRPTESSTIFLQQLGRGLRKFENKEYLTVLDFIGNDYKRSSYIALALGSLGKSTYIEKAYLKGLINTNFNKLDVPGVEIHIDELSKKEIINYLDKVNFNLKDLLKKDYLNFKNYLGKTPSHMDFLESEIAPSLDRFLRSKINGTRSISYYNFLNAIYENSSYSFNEEEASLIYNIESFLPLVRNEEYLIIEELLEDDSIDYSYLMKKSKRITKESLDFGVQLLKSKKILNEFNKLNIDDISNIKEYLLDLINYGLTRFNIEFDEFPNDEVYKLYHNYSKEQSILAINQEFKMNIKLKGNYILNNICYIYVGLKKDKNKQERTDYKDKFISPFIFQWESENDTTLKKNKGLLDVKEIHLFVRKMDEEDGIDLPFTYFGKGKFSNCRESEVIEKSSGVKHDTLLFDIILEKEVPSEYWFDFEIPEVEKI